MKNIKVRGTHILNIYEVRKHTHIRILYIQCETNVKHKTSTLSQRNYSAVPKKTRVFCFGNTDI